MRKWLLITSLPLAGLLACQSPAPRNRDASGLRISMGSYSARWAPSGGLVRDDRTRSWYSVFETKEENLAEKRRTLFLAFFADDTDPYTRETNHRSECLLSNTTEEIRFKSGGPPDWGACSRLAAPPSYARRWVRCESAVWEVTYPLDSRMGFSCE